MTFLGLDIGTSGTKALLLSKDGRVLAAAESPHTLLTPKPGWTEQQPEEWWKACALATKAALKKAKLKGSAVQGIGLSGQMHGSVFLDGRRKSAPPHLRSLGMTSGPPPQCREIEERAGGREAVIQMVSNPALTGFTAPKILWLRENEPAKYEECKQILLPKDYIRYRLTGEYCSEVSDASGTLLLDVKSRAWHREMLKQTGNRSQRLLPRAWWSQSKSPARYPLLKRNSSA